MSYSTDAAGLLAQQFTRFSTLARHQLVGQLANLDFWLREFKHSLELIDGYGVRFERLKEAQAKYTAEHQTIEFALDDPCCIRGPVSGPKRAPSSEMKKVRRELCDSICRFLRRCCDEQLIDEFAIRSASDSLGITTDLWSR
jgi:hypothetical protein